MTAQFTGALPNFILDRQMAHGGQREGRGWRPAGEHEHLSPALYHGTMGIKLKLKPPINPVGRRRDPQNISFLDNTVFLLNIIPLECQGQHCKQYGSALPPLEELCWTI